MDSKEELLLDDHKGAAVETMVFRNCSRNSSMQGERSDMSSVYDELKENGISVFLADHRILEKCPFEFSDTGALHTYLYGFPEDEQNLYLSYYLDELPDLIEEPELLWKLIVFERSIHEGDENKESWRVGFQDYIKCFPWVEDLMNISEEPDLYEWKQKSLIRKAERHRVKR